MMMMMMMMMMMINCLCKMIERWKTFSLFSGCRSCQRLSPLKISVTHWEAFRKVVNYFHKTLYLRCLTGFWIRLWPWHCPWFHIDFFRAIKRLNPFHTTDLFWYPQKTSENLWFSNVFKGYQKRPVAWNGLITTIEKTINSINHFSMLQ